MAPGPVKMEISLGTEEIHESNLVNDQSEEFIPREERTKNDILVIENFKGYTLKSRVSNFGVKLGPL